jgi:hypothetical protein
MSYKYLVVFRFPALVFTRIGAEGQQTPHIKGASPTSTATMVSGGCVRLPATPAQEF